MNYDSMSVHDLVCALESLGEREGTPRDMPYPDSLPIIESALRSAVIRESSVGEISIEQHEGYMSPDPMFTVGAKSKLKAGEFYLIPKETS